jgi:hypothetical protein
MYSYFTSTPLFGGLSIAGLVALAGGSALVLSVPPLVASSGGLARMSLGLETLVTLAPVLGLLCFAFGASPMPTILERLVTSRYADVLPGCRVKLVASAFGTVTLLALLASVVTTIYFVRPRFPRATALARGLRVSLLTYTTLYVVLWMVARSRTATGKLVGFAGVVATLVVPLRYIAVPSTPLAGAWLAAIIVWTLITAVFLFEPRVRHVLAGPRHTLAQRFAASAYRGGSEVAFMIGTARPWPFALGQAIPVVLSAYYLRDYSPLAAEAPANPWLFFMTILSVLSGGMASAAAARGRALWLRALDAGADLRACRGCLLAAQRLRAGRAARAARRRGRVLAPADANARVRPRAARARLGAEHLSRAHGHDSDRLEDGTARERHDALPDDDVDLCGAAHDSDGGARRARARARGGRARFPRSGAPPLDPPRLAPLPPGRRQARNRLIVIADAHAGSRGGDRR